MMQDKISGTDQDDHSHDATQEDAGLPVRTAGEALQVRRVFGEAYEQDGVLIVPVAKLIGGSGMGFGSGTMGQGAGDSSGGHGARSATGNTQGTGGGGGFGLRAKPLGVYQVAGGKVTWHPAIDVNRAIIGGQLVGAVAAVALSWALRRHRRQR